MSPIHACQSLRHTPLALTRITAPSGPGSGVDTWRIASFCTPSSTRAFIDVSFLGRGTAPRGLNGAHKPQWSPAGTTPRVIEHTTTSSYIRPKREDLTSQRQLVRALGHVDIGGQEGATLVAGGHGK